MSRDSEPDPGEFKSATVRFPGDMHYVLARAAFANQRSLSAEVIFRLRHVPDGGALTVHTGEKVTADYAATLGDQQRRLLSLFNAMAPEQQLALLTLLAR